MKPLHALVVFTCFFLVNKSSSQSKDDIKLIGSWKLQEIHYQYSDTTYIAKDEDYGRFIFTDFNYALMYNPMMQKRIPFKNLSKPSSEEMTKAFQNIVFNTGSYRLEDNKIITTADIAKVPGFEGGQQFYELSYKANGIELTMYDETYPNGKKPKWFGQLTIKFILKNEE